VLALVSTRPGSGPAAPTTVLAAAPSAAVAPIAPSAVLPAPIPQPAFDFAQPASFEGGVVRLPRYRGVEPQETLGPYVLLTLPQPPQQSVAPQRQ